MKTDSARRDFLRTGACALGALLMPVESPAASGPLARRVPKTGEAIPAVGLGTWQVFDVASDAKEKAQAQETLKVFVDLGGRVIDSSPMYGSSESVTGELAAALGVRAKLFFATKVWTSGRQAGIRQMEDSMKKLRVERLDLMQVHNLVDADTHLQTLREWKAAGRIRYAGVTHYHAGAHADLERYVKRGDVDFIQVNYSIAEPEADRRLRQLGAVLPEMDSRPAGRHMRHPGHAQSHAHGRQHGRRLRPAAGRGDAGEDVRLLQKRGLSTGVGMEAQRIAGQRLVTAAKPESVDEPDEADRHRGETDPRQPEPEKRQPRVGPRSDLIAGAVDERVDEALGLVLVLA